ncbi:MAG: DUF6456 domain-containing protein [Hyphomicrobiales bacterium]|nr:DUF6456 domain-containing protein [Hyphomicrobiales bacterium]
MTAGLDAPAMELLAALSAPGARLEPTHDGAASAFRVRSVKAARPAANAGAVQRLIAADLVEACEGGWRISETGRARLRRQSAAPAEAFAAQHQARSWRRDGEGARLVNDAESPLAWLRSRKGKAGEPLITAPQYEAGERLRADFERGAMQQRVTANWANPTPGDARRAAPRDPACFADSVLASRERYARALAAIGPDLAKVAEDVCCRGRGLEEMERGEGWPKRAAKIVLQLALNALARHYGLISDPAQSPATQRTRRWGAPGYRPRIDGG